MLALRIAHPHIMARISSIMGLVSPGADSAVEMRPLAHRRVKPEQPNQELTMADLSRVADGAEVIGADGVHVGTVDHIDGDRIKLTKKDSSDERHHYISGGLVAEVEGTQVRLSANADVAVTFEEAE